MVIGARFRSTVPVLCLALAFSLAGGRTSGDDAPHAGLSDYQIKAAYLYYFSTFLDWPPEAFSGPGEPLIIGVLGEDPFGEILDETVRGKTVNSRRLIVKRYHSVNDARGSHILFIGSSEQERLPSVLKALDGTAILTVGEIERFAYLGGQIGFHIEDRRVRFDINVAAVERARIKMSAQLMKLGRIVDAPGRQKG